MSVRPRSLSRAAAMASAAMLAGCASGDALRSLPLGTGDLVPTGLVYALPLAQLQLQVQQRLVTPKEVKDAEAAARQASEAQVGAAARATQAKAALAQAEALLPHVAPESVAQAQLIVQRQLAEAQSKLAAAQAEEARVKAAQALVAAEQAAQLLGQCVVAATLKALPPAPDPQARFVLRHDASAWRDDAVKLAVSERGLLQSVEAKADSQIAAVLIAIAQAVAAPSSATASLSHTKSDDKTPPDPVTCMRRVAVHLFDPTDKDSVKGATSFLAKMAPDLSLSVAPEPRSRHAKLSTAGPSGLFHRAPLLVSTQLTAASPDIDPVVLQVVVPDAGTLLVADTPTTPFVKNEVTHSFKDGMWLGVQTTRPSAAVAIASLPLEALKAMLRVPAEILKLRVDIDTEAAARATAQADLYKAQLEGLNARRALEDARPSTEPPATD